MKLARQLLLALWAGTLLGVGALLAPAVFKVLADRALAGRVAADLFHRTTLLSIACALALLVLGAAERAARPRWLRLAPLVPALLLLANDWLLRPQLAAALLGGTGRAVLLWHSAAALLYVAATAVAALLLIAELRRPA